MVVSCQVSSAVWEILGADYLERRGSYHYQHARHRARRATLCSSQFLHLLGEASSREVVKTSPAVILPLKDRILLQ